MTDEKIIEDILDEFDFGRVQKAMELLEWTWGSPPEYPTLGQLRKKARFLMKECIRHTEYTTATGGFWVQKRTFDGLPSYRLMFVVSEWGNYE